ncbi:MAG: HD domain-containing protein [Candidatus Limnocylindrales bacterium]
MSRDRTPRHVAVDSGTVDTRPTSRATADSRPATAVPRAGADPAPRIPAAVMELLDTLWRSGHAAYVVGGCLRDALLGRRPADWDLTTDAPPERVGALFPRSIYENRFGTVVVRHRSAQYEITAFRRDVSYTDHRHPDTVEFGDTIEEDLARRDFTVNAMAWGARPGETPAFVDPHGGRGDLDRRLLLAVGDPDERFREDALRMARAVRLAATLEFEVEARTLAAIGRNAGLASHLSGERVFAELAKLLGARRPSIGLRLMADSGLLAVIAPDLARQRGLEQNKIEGEDLWDHTLRTVDAARNRQVVRLAALLHDVAKPETLADGHFRGHEAVGARMAAGFLDGLHAPRALQERVAHLVLNHMFAYEPNWTDAAVRRFIRKIGPRAVDDLLALRAADNLGSGQPADAGHLKELEYRVRAELAANVVLDRNQLAIDGDDLMAELGLPQGRLLGRLLDDLTERVVAEPALNDRAILLDLARREISDRRLMENPLL